MPEYDIPERVSFERLLEILQGWYIAGADEEPVATSDIEEASGISSHIGRQKSFFEAIGLTTGNVEGYKRKLTEAGTEITEALAVDDVDTAKEGMRTLLEDWDLTTKLNRIVTSNTSISEKDLFEKVCRLLGRDPNGPSDVTTGVRTLLALFEWAEVIEREPEGDFKLAEHEISQSDAASGEDRPIASGTISQSSVDSDRIISQETRTIGSVKSVGQTEIKISLDLTGSDNPEQVGELLRQIRLVLESDLEELEDAEDVVNNSDEVIQGNEELEGQNLSRLNDFQN